MLAGGIGKTFGISNFIRNGFFQIVERKEQFYFLNEKKSWKEREEEKKKNQNSKLNNMNSY